MEMLLKIKMALVAIVLLPVLTVATSCTESRVDLKKPRGQHGVERPSASGSSGIEVNSFEYEGHRVSLISEEWRHTAVLELSYRWVMDEEKESGRATFDRIFEIGSFESRWLDAYLNHAALRFADTRERRPCVSYEIVEASIPEETLHNFTWFLEGADSIEWCPVSLAWRHHHEVVQFIKHKSCRTCDGWIPLTRESFYTWYEHLDERVGLEALLGGIRNTRGGQ